MAYFVTGATGFIGRHLVEQLLANREGDIHVLVREGSKGKLEELMASWDSPDRVKPVSRRPDPGAPGRRPGLDRRAPRGHRPLLPPRRDLRHDRRRRAQRGAERRRHPPRRPAGQRAAGRRPAPHVVGGRRRRLQGPVPRGPLRRGPEAALRLPPHEVRVREDRPRGVARALARVPPRDRHRPLPDGRDGQDRRPLLLLQGDPEAAPRAARVGPARRPRAGLDEHRPGRLRGPRDGPHRPPAGPRRAGLPPRRATLAALRRGAQHVRQGGPRAAARDPHRQEASPTRCPRASSRCC